MYEGEGGDMRSVLHPVITWRKMPQDLLAHGAARLLTLVWSAVWASFNEKVPALLP